jgi:6-phosphogluconolactonase
VAVLRVEEDGHLGEATDVVPRAAPASAQGVTLDPANHFAFVCDLGLDRILGYRFDAEAGKLAAATPPYTAVKPGAGPRHLVFRPDARFAYAINERSSTIVVFAHDAGAGALTEVQTVSTVPPYFDGPNSAAEVSVHPSGKFLYASNRGHNSVVLFAIDPAQGTLTYVEEQGTGGKKPRHFGIEPSAKHMAIANQDSDTVLACRIDAGNGRLKPSGIFASVAAPACVKFLPPPEPQRSGG